MDNSRKIFWDKVIKRLNRQPYESDGNGGKKRVSNSKMYQIYESCFGDLIDGMTPKQVARKINNEEEEEEKEILLICFKCEKEYMGFEGNCCCGKCCSYCRD